MGFTDLWADDLGDMSYFDRLLIDRSYLETSEHNDVINKSLFESQVASGKLVGDAKQQQAKNIEQSGYLNAFLNGTPSEAFNKDWNEGLISYRDFATDSISVTTSSLAKVIPWQIWAVLAVVLFLYLIPILGGLRRS